MNTIDLENLYVKIRGRISLIGSYIQNENIVDVIKSCRLKPYSIFVGEFKPGTRLEDHWVDEFGNSLKIKDKIPTILLNDPCISENTKISSDLFYGSAINNIAETSKSIFLAQGKYIGSYFCLVAVYCSDEYYRVFAYNGKWNRISPLLLGVNTHYELLKHMGKHYVEIDKKRLDLLIDFDVEKCALISLPIRSDKLKEFDYILNMIKGDNI